MATIAIFHSALGIREGVRDAARRLRDAGHDPHIVDYYGDHRSFDDLASAAEHINAVGFPALMQAAVDGVADLADGFSVLGFSNGSGMAEYVATRRPVTKAVLGSGTLPLAMMGADAWPARTAAQIHYAADDPFRNDEWLESVIDSVRSSGAPLEVYTEYAGAGHLFTDPTLPDYDEANTELFWQRVRAFLA
jgi:dienelactone hydrolase